MTDQLMTVELLKAALPPALHTNASQDLADKINQLAVEPEMCAEIRGNFLTFSKVMTEGKYKTEDYLSAIVYVTHKLMGYSNKDAYIRTFPDRYQNLMARGVTDVSPYVAGYHKNQLVNKIMEQTLIPLHLVYQDALHSAIQTQLRLMTSASSEKVQSDAANSILTHLKAPEIKKVEVDVNVKQNGGIDDLKATMTQLARTQLEHIQGKHGTAGSIAAAPLVMITQKEKDEAINVESVRIEPIEAAAVEQDQLAEACPHDVPYRYPCEFCNMAVEEARTTTPKKATLFGDD